MEEKISGLKVETSLSDEENLRSNLNFKEIEKTIKEALQNYLSPTTLARSKSKKEKKSKTIHDEGWLKNLTIKLNEAISNKCPSINKEGYKFIVTSTFMTQFGQGISLGGKCLWNEETDGVLTVKATSDDDYLLIMTVYFLKINQTDQEDSEED